MTFFIDLFENSEIIDYFLFEQNTFLFTCIITFFSLVSTDHLAFFSPYCRRVASTDLLVFIVNRLKKLHSKILLVLVITLHFLNFSVFLMNLSLCWQNTKVKLVSFQLSYFRLQN